MASKAAALRWLTDRVGSEIDTVQVRPSGMAWRPGPRTLGRKGNGFVLDGSEVRFTRSHVVLEVSDERLMLEWVDHEGVRIHVMIYSDVESEEEDE